MAASARTEGESRIANGARAGELIDLGDLTDEQRVVSANLIRRLCTGQDGRGVDPRGLRVKRATVVDGLDLSFAVVSFPLCFEETTFVSQPDLTAAQLPALRMTGCSLPGLACEGLRLTGDLSLESSEIEGEVLLRGAPIGGSLLCVGSRVSNPDGDALFADLCEVAGGVFLREPSSFVGAVRFPAAKIRGDFDCTGATLTDTSDSGLMLDGVEISGNLNLQKLKATGPVQLPSARIGGHVSVQDASLRNEGPTNERVSSFADKYAIYADNAEVSGSFYLGYGLEAHGTVRLVGAKIGGDLLPVS